MLRLRIGEILDEREMTTDDFAKQAGIAYNTALAMRRGSSTRIDLETLEKVCATLGIAPGELFEYTPSGKKKA